MFCLGSDLASSTTTNINSLMYSHSDKDRYVPGADPGSPIGGGAHCRGGAIFGPGGATFLAEGAAFFCPDGRPILSGAPIFAHREGGVVAENFGPHRPSVKRFFRG